MNGQADNHVKAFHEYRAGWESYYTYINASLLRRSYEFDRFQRIGRKQPAFGLGWTHAVLNYHQLLTIG